MDVVLHQITECIIDQAMPLNEGFVLKCGCNNMYDKMAAATDGTRVSGMFGAFIDDFQRFRVQGLRQAEADPVNAVAGHVRGVPC